jgi:hypothetical protein
MAFFKATRDQLKANAFVSNLELAKAKFRPNDSGAAALHIKWAFEAMEKVKEAKAGYIFSRQGWLYAADLCFTLFNMLSEVGRHRLAHTCFFMYEWALWNEDQIGQGGVISSVRSALSPTKEGDAVGNTRSPEPKFSEDDAEARINAALVQQAVELDLSELELTALPASLRTFTDVQSLNLSRNQLTGLPDWIGELKNLQNLDLSGNHIRRLPASLGKLASLGNLSICDAQLTRLPEMLDQLTHLQELYLYGNQFAALPESLGNLTSLRKLSVGYNQLETLPESLGKLTHLEELYLEENRLTSLPKSLGDLPNLVTLDICGNLLSGSPESFGKLAKLLESQL